MATCEKGGHTVDAGKVATCSIGGEKLTVYHVFNGLFVFFAQVDDTGLGLAELTTACSIKEAGAGAEDSAVDSPLPCVAADGQIGVFSAQVKTVKAVRPGEEKQQQ